MSSPWIDNNGRLMIYSHERDCMVCADEMNKMCPFTLGYCQTLDQRPAVCFKDACELWDPVMERCPLSDRIRNPEH